MAKASKSVLDGIKGLKKADPQALVRFKEVMNKDVIPKIVQKVEARRLRAAKSRNRRLKG